MKPFFFAFICVLMLNSCKKVSQEASKEPQEFSKNEYVPFGKSIIPDDAIEAKSMVEHYKTMNLGDSINSKMIAKVTEVCQSKGCWMTLNLEEGKDVMVKFKDYGFFMPKDIAGKKVIVNGKAFVEEVSVDEQIHYAEDAGQSEEEIAKIIEPKRTFSFEADGVLLIQ